MLRELFKDYFKIGNILSPKDLADSALMSEFTKHYNAFTAENNMKPMYIGVSEDEFDFKWADMLVEWAEKAGVTAIGHTLVWHGQSAPWLNMGADGAPLPRAKAMANMEKFIKGYVSRYSGRIYSWDVVNEAFKDDREYTGDWRDGLRKLETNPKATAPWYLAFENGADKAKGESGADYIFYAFYFARKYDSKAVLYYNDYNEEVPVKRAQIADMVESVNELWKSHADYDGRLLIEGIGMQGHCNHNTNLADVKESVDRFARTGARISITELDVTFGAHDNPAVPLTAEQAEQQAAMYVELFKIYLDYSKYIERVTFWGMNDERSWRAWGSPTLFDGAFAEKVAYREIAGLM
ncbi:MAG: endo-1,4-beta-xylanase [Turicibacter sp.]|nr:endo-1,4-beta-xylanase [Turicibacter sp.]